MKKLVLAGAVLLTACRALAETGAATLPAVDSLTPVDCVLLCVVVFLAVFGLVRGLSGQLGSFAGLVAAVLAGYALYPVAVQCANAFSFGHAGTVVLDFVFAFLAFGLVRMLVGKFVSVMLGKPVDCLLGFLIGCFKGGLLLGLLAGVGIMKPGTYSTGILTSHSVLIQTVAGWADASVQGDEG